MPSPAATPVCVTRRRNLLLGVTIRTNLLPRSEKYNPDGNE
jgi:hypothetical protein